MDEETFKTELAASGYSQIDSKALDSRPANVQHAHDHDVRGLVIDGLFTVWQGDQAVSYRSGEIFFVPSGLKHSEEIGPDGTRVVIGRKWAKPVV